MNNEKLSENKQNDSKVERKLKEKQTLELSIQDMISFLMTNLQSR